MDQKQPMGTTRAELLQTQAELWCHTYSYIKSVALYTAVKLGIPNAVHRCGGAATMSDLLAAVHIHPSKQPYLPRLMTMLAAAGIFTAQDAPAEGEAATTATRVYRLTPVSRLLVDDVGGDARASLSRFVLTATWPLADSLCMDKWFQSEDAAATKTPFTMARGRDFYDFIGSEPELNAVFNEGMEADSLFVVEPVIEQCGEVFAGATSLVDVGGGNGTMAKAIATAFPHVKCSVLELPHVVDSIPANGTVEFVAGDMMEFIPPADVVLLKFVLHNWSDKDCVKISQRSREAISQGPRAGKVIIIDTVLGSASQQVLEAQHLMDICMMTFLNGKERGEQNWHQIIMEAGFSHYKIRPILGVRSVIEVYP